MNSKLLCFDYRETDYYDVYDDLKLLTEGEFDWFVMNKPTEAFLSRYPVRFYANRPRGKSSSVIKQVKNYVNDFVEKYTEVYYLSTKTKLPQWFKIDINNKKSKPLSSVDMRFVLHLDKTKYTTSDLFPDFKKDKSLFERFVGEINTNTKRVCCYVDLENLPKKSITRLFDAFLTDGDLKKVKFKFFSYKCCAFKRVIDTVNDCNWIVNKHGVENAADNNIIAEIQDTYNLFDAHLVFTHDKGINKRLKNYNKHGRFGFIHAKENRNLVKDGFTFPSLIV